MSPLVVVIDGDLDPAARLVSVVPAAWRLRAPGSSRSDDGRLGAGLVVGGTLGADADVAAADEVEVLSDDGIELMTSPGWWSAVVVLTSVVRDVVGRLGGIPVRSRAGSVLPAHSC